MAMLPDSTAMFLILTNYDLDILRNPIPIACNWHVTGVTQSEHNFCKADRVAVAQQELGIAIDTDRIDPVVIPITYHRPVT